MFNDNQNLPILNFDIQDWTSKIDNFEKIVQLDVVKRGVSANTSLNGSPTHLFTSKLIVFLGEATLKNLG